MYFEYEKLGGTFRIEDGYMDIIAVLLEWRELAEQGYWPVPTAPESTVHPILRTRRYRARCCLFVGDFLRLFGSHGYWTPSIPCCPVSHNMVQGSRPVERYIT